VRTFKVVKLSPKGPFKEIPRATTIFGAIANAIKTLYEREEVEKFIEEFRKKGKISSAFPYHKDTYFLPIPLSVELTLFQIFEEDISKVKEVRAKGYIPLEDFERAIRLEKFEAREELPYKKVEIPKVSLDRVSQDSSLYFWDAITFKEDSGLYFLYDGPKDLFEKYIVPAVAFLGDHGIGGKGTWGFGLFVPEFESISIDEPQGDGFATLSPTYPKNPNSLILWRIEKLGGWSEGKRKPKIPMVTEGSVLRDPGDLVELDLGLSYKVYVNGKSFPIQVEVPRGAL